jgi:hypothetical protein
VLALDTLFCMHVSLETDATTQQETKKAHGAMGFGVAPHRNTAQQTQHPLNWSAAAHTLPLGMAPIEWFRPTLTVGLYCRLQTELMKRAATLASILSRDTPWLRWWQGILLNWVASWDSVGTITVTRPDGDEYVAWDLPSDLDLKRLELEELLNTPAAP